MKRSLAEAGSLAVAFGAAAGAFVSAFAGLRLPMALLLMGGLSLLAWSAQRHSVQIRRLPSMPAIVRILLVVIGVVALVSRDVPVIADEIASRVGLLAGAALLACAVALLWAGSAWPVPVALLPAIVGLVVTAGLEGKGWYVFVPLGCVCGAALWTWALASGGPRRRVLPLAFFFLAVAGVAVGAVLFLPWAQPYVEAFVARGLSEGQTGLSNRTRLGDIQKLAQSPRVLARVWTTEPQLLRMQVLTNFDSRTGAWSVEPAKPRELLPSDGLGASLGLLLSAAPGELFSIASQSRGPVVETRVMPSLSYDDGWGLLVPAHPSVLRAPAEKVKVDDDTGIVSLGSGDVPIYGVANGPPSSVPAEPPPNDPTRNTLDNERIRRMAADLGGEQGTAQQKVSRTVDYLKGRAFRYTLEGLPGSLSLDEFLQKKAGYCEYFATAAVLLLRERGVPARYVRGVRVNSESKVGDHYLVRESDAHAWVEAYLPGEGWVEADPTPGGSDAAHANRLGLLEAKWEAIESWFLETWIRLREEGWPGLRARLMVAFERARLVIEHRPALVLGGLGGLALASLAWRFRRHALRPRPWPLRSQTEHALVPSELRAMVKSIEERWARVGRPRPPTRGLREHLDALPRDLLGSDEREVAGRIVAAYYRTRYGGATLSESEISDLHDHAAALRR